MRKILFSFIILLFSILVACSSQDEGTNESNNADTAHHEEGIVDNGAAADYKGYEPQAKSGGADQDRMVMYHVYMRIGVKNIENAMETITQFTTSKNGYIVQSSVTNYEQKQHANMQVRIPNQDLETFIEEIVSISDQLIEKQQDGQDVTEEYVDLTSRLKAKKAVEERLLDFMEKAETTEDLLKISNDLARVQEEIEQLEGRKKYLENRTDFAEVNISLEDVSVQVPEIAEEDLQTSERIKQAFANSLNGIARMFSALAVLVIGYSPFITMFGVIGGLIWFIYHRKRSHHTKDND
ncbi:MAG: DUF4349 domain-containing protein [Bacillaceae bacterium]|nr:DUF4349 domain-containing protein [Bacillaceae bacterium]